MNTPRPAVSVFQPLNPAMERMKDLLFRPFDLYRWLCIGFTAWLATLADGGGGGGGGNYGNTRRGQGFGEFWDQGVEYFRDNWGWIVPLALFLLVVVVTVGLVMLWLSSRGRFMFLHNVARNRADVVAPWHAYREQGNSLFLFRLVVSLIGLIAFVPLVAVLGFSIVTMLRREEVLPLPMLLAVISFLGVLAVALASVLIDKLTKDFVVPIMFIRHRRCQSAWGDYYRLMSANLGNFVVYVLFYLLLSLAVGVALIFVVLITCCVAGCFLALPYLGTVLFLPVLVFFRAYSAGYLAQFGPDYDVFGPAASGPPDPVSPAPPTPTFPLPVT